MRPETVVAPPQARLLTRAISQSWRTLLAAGLCSGAVNVLALTGPIYMLVVYNDALPSQSAPQLAAFTAAMLSLYALSGFVDYARARLMGAAGLRLGLRLGEAAFAIQQDLALKGGPGESLQPLRDLEQIRTFVAGTGPTVVFDLPWMPLYLCVIYALHPLLAALALAGAGLLVGLMLLAERWGRSGLEVAALSAARRWSFAASAGRNAEAARAMALNPNLLKRWSVLSAVHGRQEREGVRAATAIASAIKVARPALQSATLGLGAYLFLVGQASAGAMIAASILLSRALAPLETAIAHWRGFSGAHASYRRLNRWLAALPLPTAQVLKLPSPCQGISVERIAVAPPGTAAPTVRTVSFALKAGDGLGIVGPSGSGKSTLARAIVGVWPVQSGLVAIDGKPMPQWNPDLLGRHIGFMPQEATLLCGSIADNIARFDANASERAITAAARAAGVHEMILRLREGYATDFGDGGAVLSAGQRQRIALARALYGEPFLVVLDEPNANLDAEGDACLTAAIASVRRRGGIAIVIAHRRSALVAVDQVLALANGRAVALGPKATVLQGVLEAPALARAPVTAAE